MTMNLQPYSWNTHLINDYYWSGTTPKVGTWASGFPAGQRANLNSSALFSDVAYSFPKLSTTQIGGHYIALKIFAKAAAPTTFSTERAQLEGWFSILDFQPHQLIAYDVEDSNRPWYLTGIPVTVLEDAAGVYTVVLALDDPVWRLVTPSTTGNIAVTTNPNTQNLTILGNVPAKPIITIKPTSSRTAGYAYKVYVPIYNTTAVPFPFAVSSIDITNGGLNTAALVAGGKMLASGDDCRVFVDGIDANRWFGGNGINNTLTEIWCNIAHSAGAVGRLSANLANSGTAVTVSFTKNPANLAALKVLAKAKNTAFIIDSEVFTYTAKKIDLTKYKITTCQRAQKNTSFAAHTAGANITWIQHDVWLMYGNSAATPPNIDDTKKPLLDLVNSTNSSFAWSQFYDNTSNRPMAWTPAIVSSITNGLAKQTLSNYYTADQGAFANPASELGLQMQSYNHNAVKRAETAVEMWRVYYPAGFTSSSMAGKKYLQLSVGAWPAKAALQKSTDNINYANVWNEAVPSLASWTAFTHNGVTLSGTYQYIRLFFGGSIAAGADNIAYLQGDSVTLAVGANKLTVSLNAEIGNYYIDASITNNTSGEVLYVVGTMGLNETLTIDCNAKTAVLDDGTNFFNGISLSDGRVNPDWLDLGLDTSGLWSGAAQIVYASNGVIAETLNISWSDSSY